MYDLQLLTIIINKCITITITIAILLCLFQQKFNQHCYRLKFAARYLEPLGNSINFLCHFLQESPQSIVMLIFGYY